MKILHEGQGCCFPALCTTHPEGVVIPSFSLRRFRFLPHCQRKLSWSVLGLHIGGQHQADRPTPSGPTHTTFHPWTQPPCPSPVVWRESQKSRTKPSHKYPQPARDSCGRSTALSRRCHGNLLSARRRPRAELAPRVARVSHRAQVPAVTVILTTSTRRNSSVARRDVASP